MCKNEIVSFTGKWMELEIIMLSELSQAQRPNIPCFHSFLELRPKMVMIIMGHEWGDDLGGNQQEGEG
jgi:hypothetical protein